MPDSNRSASGSTVPADRGSAALVDAACIGLPDAVTALWCLWAWIHPLAFGPETVKCVVLMMLMEFILLNATGFFTVIPFMLDLGRCVRLGMLAMLCAIYVALIAAFAMQFHAIWPYFTFGWMVAAKVVWIVRNRRVTQAEQMWLMGGWAVSVVAYLGAVGLGATQNVPQLGITSAVLPLMNLHDHRGWVDLVETPHRTVASAVFYFAAIALFKWMYVVVRRHRLGRQQRAALNQGMDDSFDSA